MSSIRLEGWQQPSSLFSLVSLLKETCSAANLPLDSLISNRFVSTEAHTGVKKLVCRDKVPFGGWCSCHHGSRVIHIWKQCDIQYLERYSRYWVISDDVIILELLSNITNIFIVFGNLNWRQSARCKEVK